MKNSKEQQRQAIEHYLYAYNGFDVDGMVNGLHEEVVFENVSNGKVDVKTEGITAFRKQAEAARHYFTERQQAVESWEFKDSAVTVTIFYSAILAIDLPNGMKAGDTLELKGQSVFLFADNKIIGISDRS